MPRMLNGLHRVSFAVLSLAVGAAHAFERVEVTFAPPGASAAAEAVRISFVGKNLDPALDVLKSDPVPDREVRQFQEFLKNFHRANLDGSKGAILQLWAPAERGTIEAGMDEKSLAENKARFQDMAGLKLRGIIKYGAYHIVFLRTEYSTGVFPFKVALKSIDGKLYLSNALNGDHFYDNVSHFIDRPDAKQAR